MTNNYLAEYDAAADSDKQVLVNRWLKEETLPFLKQLREERPILVTPECALISKFTDVRDALQMPKIFTVDLYKSKMGVTADDPGYLMAHDDDALHTREKSLMKGFLNRDDLPHVRNLIQDASKKIIKKANGSAEIVNEYCRVVPSILVQEYFGLDGIAAKKLMRWSFWNQYDSFYNHPYLLYAPAKTQHIIDEHEKVTKELVPYIAALMARKLFSVKVLGLFTAPFRFIGGLFGMKFKDDMVKRMLRSSMAKKVDFSLLRVGVNAGGLLIGAVDTTSQAVSQAIKFFIERPELLCEARAAASMSDPAKFDAMVWEALRFVPIGAYVPRKMSEDYTLAKGTDRETTITAGTNVLVLTQSAMFDDYAFEDPDSYNPNRNWYHYFTFGFASHECLGKYIGMAMIPEMVRQVVLMDELKATSEMDYQDGPFPEDYHLSWG